MSAPHSYEGAKTPRTDALQEKWAALPGVEGGGMDGDELEEAYEHARQLERELAEANHWRERWSKEQEAAAQKCSEWWTAARPYSTPTALREALDSLRPERGNSYRDELQRIIDLSNKCLDAWAGGIGNAELDDVTEMGRIAIRLRDGHRPESSRSDLLATVCKNFLAYRARNTSNFQLEKADDYFREMRVALDLMEVRQRLDATNGSSS